MEDGREEGKEEVEGREFESSTFIFLYLHETFYSLPRCHDDCCHDASHHASIEVLLKTECWEGKKGRREGGREGEREGERREGGRV